MKEYIFRVLRSIDQLGNALTGGHEDETISSRLGRFGGKDSKHPNKVKRFFARAICGMLHPFDPNHCKDAIEPCSDHNKLSHDD